MSESQPTESPLSDDSDVGRMLDNYNEYRHRQPDNPNVRRFPYAGVLSRMIGNFTRERPDPTEPETHPGKRSRTSGGVSGIDTDTPGYDPGDNPAYDFLLPKPYSDVDAVILMGQIREAVESFPHTSPIVSRSQIAAKTDYSASSITLDFLKMAGMWRIPEHYTGNSKQDNRAKVVNPHTPDAWLYSDVYPRCRCGALVLTMDHHGYSPGNHNHRFPGDVEHSDDCRKIWRWRARSKLAEARQDAALESLYYSCHTGGAGDIIASRLGYTVPDDASKNCHALDVDYVEKRKEARVRAAHTAAAWAHRYSMSDVAPAFGMTKTSIHECVKEHVDIDLRESYRIRMGHNNDC